MRKKIHFICTIYMTKYVCLCSVAYLFVFNNLSYVSILCKFFILFGLLLQTISSYSENPSNWFKIA